MSSITKKKSGNNKSTYVQKNNNGRFNKSKPSGGFNNKRNNNFKNKKSNRDSDELDVHNPLSYHQMGSDSEDERDDAPDLDQMDRKMEKNFQDEEISDAEVENEDSDDDIHGDSLFSKKKKNKYEEDEEYDGVEYIDFTDLLDDENMVSLSRKKNKNQPAQPTKPATSKKQPTKPEAPVSQKKSAAVVQKQQPKKQEPVYEDDEDDEEIEEDGSDIEEYEDEDEEIVSGEEEDDEDDDLFEEEDFEDVEGDEDDDENVEDDEDDEGHGKLVSVIDGLNKKSKSSNDNKLSEVTEYFGDESEFGLQPTLDDQILMSDLLNMIPESSGFDELRNELTNLAEKEALPLPMSKLDSNRIQRKVTLKATKKILDKWMPFIQAEKDKASKVYESKIKVNQTVSLASAASSSSKGSELDDEINAALRESGVQSVNRKDKINQEEERNKLREIIKLRNIMFYQELKNKRKSKIKSKSYRKIQKKQKEKEKDKREEELAKLDPEFAKRRQEMAEELRIRERMTLRHKNHSKFMKNVLKGGMNTEIRQDINERKELGATLLNRMNKRKNGSDDELDTHEDHDDNEHDQPSEKKSSRAEISRDDVDSIDKAMPMKDRIQAKLELLGLKQQVDVSEKGINAMKFMQSKLERDLDQRLKNAVNGGKTDDYDEMEEETRKVVEENENRIALHRPVKSNRGSVSADQLVNGVAQLDQVALSAGHKMRLSEPISIGKNKTTSSVESVKDSNKKLETNSIKVNKEIDEDNLDEQLENPWLEVTKSNKTTKNKEKKKQSQKLLVDMDVLPNNNNKNNKRKNVDNNNKVESTESTPTNKKRKHPGMSLITSNKQKELLLEAFAKDNVEDEFAKVKQEILEQELEEQEEMNSAPKVLPGWGSWTGDGIKQKKVDQAKLKREHDAKMKSIAQKRTDFNNNRVIIDEKSKLSGVSKYLLSKKPMHYDTKEQYESTLSTPLGKDWNTRTVYQKLIEPKVSVAAGTYIKPVSRVERNEVNQKIMQNKKESSKVTSLAQVKQNKKQRNTKL